jgi:hypothetical protein
LCSNGVKLAYVNDDDYLDILIANGGVGGSSAETFGQENSLYINNGDGTFTDRSDLLPERNDIDLYSASAGVDAADLDNDGLVDVIVFANNPQEILYGWRPITRAYYVYRGGAGGTFKLFDLTEPMFSFGDTSFDNDAQDVPREDYTWGAFFADVNGDQVPDLLIVTDGQNRLFETRYR